MRRRRYDGKRFASVRDRPKSFGRAAVDPNVLHDPSLARQARAPRTGFVGRLAVAFGLAESPPPSPVADVPDESGPGVEALAAMLAELIASAQSQVDGAAALVVRSADEAGAYCRTLDVEARALEAALPADLAAVLVHATRSMIDRATSAEARLRGMSDELEVLRNDLDEARTAAERDPLTGLPNRRAMEKALAAAVASAHATTTALTLAFCDIDQFKRINDRHGHALGDRVLRLVGDALADGAGEKAFVSRHGGEEFMMLFEGLRAEEAAAKVDAIRACLGRRMLRSRIDDQPIGTISFSAGIAALRPDEPPEELCRRADRALYRAKHAGRDRVEIDRAD